MRYSRSSHPVFSSTTGKLAIALVVISVLAQLGPRIAQLFVMTPALVLHGWVWQIVTYPFIETSVISLLIDVLVLVMIGLGVEGSWGSRRVLLLSAGTATVAGALTCLLALVVPALLGYPFMGASVLVTALWIAYGLAFGSAQMNFWGIPMTGNGLAWVGVGFVALNAVFAHSIVPVVPELFAVVLTFAYFKLGSPRVLWLRARQWQLQKQLKGRSRHLKVVGRDRNTSSDSDRYLH